MGEIKDPVKTVKRSAPASLVLVAILYILCNVAYFAAVPKADIKKATTTTASLFFSAVFGSKAAKGLNILVILSAFGNLVCDLDLCWDRSMLISWISDLGPYRPDSCHS